MADILVYALHYDGAFNKNSLGAVVGGARGSPAALGGEAHAVVARRRGDRRAVRAARRLRRRAGPPRARGPRGLRSRSSTRWRRWSREHGFGYALFGGGLLGFEIGAGLAARLGAGVAMEVTGGPRARRQADRASARSSATRRSREIEFRGAGRDRHRPAERVRRRPRRAARSRRSRTSTVAFSTSRPGRAWSRRGEQRGENVDIEGADILVAGGRGLGRAEGFELCEELAKALGSAAPRSRRRAPSSTPAGTPTPGRSARPARRSRRSCTSPPGICGAIQHKVGMQASENIVAINKDANAPIFEFADLGIVGDLNKILPKLDRRAERRARGARCA